MLTHKKFLKVFKRKLFYVYFNIRTSSRFPHATVNLHTINVCLLYKVMENKTKSVIGMRIADGIECAIICFQLSSILQFRVACKVYLAVLVSCLNGCYSLFIGMTLKNSM